MEQEIIKRLEKIEEDLTAIKENVEFCKHHDYANSKVIRRIIIKL